MHTHTQTHMYQVSSRICSISWTSDGNLLAMGCFDGSVIIRDKAGTEKTRIETGSSPAWAVSWNPSVSRVPAQDGLWLGAPGSGRPRGVAALPPCMHCKIAILERSYMYTMPVCVLVCGHPAKACAARLPYLCLCCKATELTSLPVQLPCCNLCCTITTPLLVLQGHHTSCVCCTPATPELVLQS